MVIWAVICWLRELCSSQNSDLYVGPHPPQTAHFYMQVKSSGASRSSPIQLTMAQTMTQLATQMLALHAWAAGLTRLVPCGQRTERWQRSRDNQWAKSWRWILQSKDTFSPFGWPSIHVYLWTKSATVYATGKHNTFTQGYLPYTQGCSQYKKDALRKHAMTIDYGPIYTKTFTRRRLQQ